MSFEFQSTLVNVTPNFRISGAQIGGVRILYNGDIKVARLIVTNDRDIQFALSGPYETGDPDGIYATLSSDLYELVPGILVNEGAISSIEMDSEKVLIDLEGADLKYLFELDTDATAPVELNSHTHKLPPAGFAALSAAASTWRSSMDGTLEGLSVAITTEVADRIAADAAIQADVDQNEADADAAIAAEATARDDADQVIIASVANEASTREAADTALQSAIDSEAATREAADTAEATARTGADDALSARLDVLELDPTTATAVASGDAATLSSANTYTDTSITNLVNGADAALDTLKEIGDALAQGDSDVTAALTAQITTEATTRAAADTALSGRLDTLEVDPTTQSALDAEVTARTSADSALDGRVTALEGNAAITDPTTATAVAAVQSDVDANETASSDADAALSARLDVLEADATTATAVAAVQSDVDQNEADSDAADAALSARIDVLESDPTTQTLLDAEAAARAAGDTAANTYTDTQIANLIGAAPGVLNTLEEIANSINDDADVYTNIVSQIVAGDTSEATTRAAADTALSNRVDVLEADPTTATAVAAVQADVDQNEADADAALALRALLDGSNIPGPYANDAAAAAAGVGVGSLYKHDNGQIHYRVS